MPQERSFNTATIASSASLSGAVQARGLVLTAIAMPDGWDAASITFQSSSDSGTTWVDLYDETGEVEVSTTGADRVIALNQTPFLGLEYLKVRSGTTGTPVNQTAERAITLIFTAVN